VKRKKVLHIGKYLPPATGGMENSILHICRTLSTRDDYDVVLVGTRQGQLAMPSPFEIPLRDMKTLATVASTPLALGLHQILRAERPDLIHVHLPNPWITLLLSLWRGPMIATYHCDVPNYPMLGKMYSPILHRFLNRCQKVIATSPQLIRSSQTLRKFESKVDVIPLSIPDLTGSPRQESRVQELHEKFGPRMILFVGRLVGYKGLPYLIEAMREVDGQLVVVGQGPLREELAQQVRELGLDRKVHFAGFVPDADLVHYYESARVVALSSINSSEALGICLIEALSFGRPLITTRLPTGVSFVNQDGVTGLEVPVCDAKALAAALNQVLGHPLEWDRLSRNARSRFDEQFDLKKIVQRHVDLYDRVLQP
jgi:rhamnosyl/mannosyltransferase